MITDNRRRMDRLAELRERRALTLRELSEMSGVAADTINQIELGHRKARPSTLRKLARALDVEVRELFEEPALPKGDAPREAGQPTEVRPIQDNLDVVEAVRDAVLLREKRREQGMARAHEAQGVPQTAFFGSGTPGSIEDLEHHLKERFNDPQFPESFGEMMFSALYASVQRHVDLEKENARLKEENATLRDRLQERERTHS
jgi:transcriptional regulator with XRE-family HTH domain